VFKLCVLHTFQEITCKQEVMVLWEASVNDIEMELRFWSYMTNDKNDVDMTKNWCNMVKFLSLEKKNVNILSVHCYLISRRHLFDGSQALTTNTDKSSIKMMINMEHWWNDTDREKLKHSVKIWRIEEYKPWEADFLIHYFNSVNL
jgi:hypothetical protein